MKKYSTDQEKQDAYTALGSSKPVDTLKALVAAEKQVKLARAEVTSLNKRLKMLERRVSNLEQWKGEQK